GRRDLRVGAGPRGRADPRAAGRARRGGVLGHLQRDPRDRYLSALPDGPSGHRKAGILLRASMVRDNDRAFVRPRRFIAMGLAILVVFTTLTVRLYDLQITNGGHYRSLSEQNRVLRLPVTAERGSITDRNGYVLARNIPGFAVTVLPVDLTRAQQPLLASKLGAIVGRDPEELMTLIDNQRIRNPYEPVKRARTPVGRDIALVLSNRPELFPGVRVEAESIRSYVDATLYAPVLGYVGAITEDELTDLKDQGYLPTDIIGRTGLELEYENYLRGQYGWRDIERDAAQC